MPSQPLVANTVALSYELNNGQRGKLDGMEKLRHFFILGHDGEKWNVMTNINLAGMNEVRRAFDEWCRQRGLKFKTIRCKDAKTARRMSKALKKLIGQKA
jgi:hypothetical protein